MSKCVVEGGKRWRVVFNEIFVLKPYVVLLCWNAALLLMSKQNDKWNAAYWNSIDQCEGISIHKREACWLLWKRELNGIIWLWRGSQIKRLQWSLLLLKLNAETETLRTGSRSWRDACPCSTVRTVGVHCYIITLHLGGLKWQQWQSILCVCLWKTDEGWQTY